MGDICETSSNPREGRTGGADAGQRKGGAVPSPLLCGVLAVVVPCLLKIGSTFGPPKILGSPSYLVTVPKSTNEECGHSGATEGRGCPAAAAVALPSLGAGACCCCCCSSSVVSRRLLLVVSGRPARGEDHRHGGIWPAGSLG